jgi:hypothetical protein
MKVVFVCAMAVGALSCTGRITGPDSVGLNPKGGSGSASHAGQSGKSGNSPTGNGGKGSEDGNGPDGGAGSSSSDPLVDPKLCVDDTPDPSVSDLRRMTKAQYLNAVRDIFDDKVVASQTFPSGTDTSVTGFSTEAAISAPSQQNVEQVMNAAEEVAETTSKALTDLLPCATETTPGLACANSFIDKYARRAFRRAPSDAERADLIDAFQGGAKMGASFPESIALLVDLMLQMPQFLYVVEEAAPGGRALSGTEIASRLSFMFWDSIPDDELLSAAEDDQLSTAKEVVAQAKRLLASPKADTTFARFVREWSGAKQVTTANKDAATFPYFTPDYAKSMNESFDRFAIDILRSKGTLHDLLRSPDVFVDENMASFFGVPAPDSGTWAKATLDATRYTGVMTQPVLLASLAHSIESSYVFRGRTLRKRVLCTQLGSPPANAMAEFAKITLPKNPTGKEVSASVQARGSCAGCHSLMDPMGLAFEHFDALGHYRDKYASGRDIDPSGSVLMDSGDTITFADQSELMEEVSNDPAAQSCFAKQVFRFTMSRKEMNADACALQQIEDALASSNGDVAAALVAVTATDAFRYRMDP